MCRLRKIRDILNEIVFTGNQRLYDKLATVNNELPDISLKDNIHEFIVSKDYKMLNHIYLTLERFLRNKQSPLQRLIEFFTVNN